ncbi:sulfatase [Carboxylicivirga mesophila]|uniref:Sulfatase n=1 Tax=Carboxylicivirga mesophila TaxID=1166478 RepID=A0ABS5KFR5_9BACT|nr:sulfatase [Carboxylicivirga mesophila]MBS2213861.1 sulfatase [Carboxylicivirga mesophila]
MKLKILIAGLLIGGLFCACQKSQQNKPPNIIFFLADDLGWADVGYNGSQFYETPNIDQLAKEGMVFTNAYATHPRCVPSRYSIITGKYPARAQMPGPGEGKLNVRPGDEGKLKADEQTIASALKEAGYATFFAGKWHLATSGTLPQDVGFDVNIAGGHAGSPISYFYPYNEGPQKGKKAPIEGLEDGAEGQYLTDHLTDKTIGWLKQHNDEQPEQPFFAFVSHYAVHEPLHGKPEHVEKFRNKLATMTYEGDAFIGEGTGTTKMHQDDPEYAALIYSMDESLGRILKTVEEMGETENTVLIFFSDNGGLSNRGFNPRRVATSNHPLRAGKGHLYEGGIREAMIVKWPGKILAGSQSDHIVTGTDFFPTILNIAGRELLPQAHRDGASFNEQLYGDAQEGSDRAIFWHSPVSRPHATGDINCSAIRLGNYKLIDFYDEKRVELYDLSTDLEEKNDLSTELPGVKQKLYFKLKYWRDSTGAYMAE